MKALFFHKFKNICLGDMAIQSCESHIQYDTQGPRKTGVLKH